METARFSLADYHFDKVVLNLDRLRQDSSFNINFNPSGFFLSESKEYILTFLFTAGYDDDDTEPIMSVRCQAKYIFKNVSSFEEIPSFFYNNAIAILFPYIRSFISTVTLQANIQPLLLPTLNLSDLQDILKKNTTEK